MTETAVVLVNPLPAALHHYTQEMRCVLRASGVDVEIADHPGGERSGRRASRLERGMMTIRWRRAFASESRPAIVTWPLFGLADPVTWLARARRTYLVVHDPKPLRAQPAMGGVARTLGRWAASRTTILVHSRPAASSLAEAGWKPIFVPHPILPPDRHREALPGNVRVLGQWKPARALAPLRQLATATTWQGRLAISGRGWPEVDGWRVESDFLSEDALEERIDTAIAVVIPYQHYFQSGIAVRCLERGVPVVAVRHPFIEDLFGADWPGIVESEDDWNAAAIRAAEVEAVDLQRLHERYWVRAVSGWRDILTRVAGGVS